MHLAGGGEKTRSTPADEAGAAAELLPSLPRQVEAHAFPSSPSPAVPSTGQGWGGKVGGVMVWYLRGRTPDLRT